jgi:ABC-type amino acid transport substrate-binding protein
MFQILQLGAAFIAALIFLSNPSVARPLDEVVASGTLRVISYVDNAPFSFEENGVAKGIDVDLGHAIARELGVQAEIVLRMQGEKVDDDIRANVWRGPLTGGGTGDLMLSVPVDRELSARNLEAVFGNAYFQERIGVAIHPELTGPNPTFDVFKTQKIGVRLATVSDYFLLTYQDGALINNVSHHVKADAGAQEFVRKEIAALMGVRSELEMQLAKAGLTATMVEPDMTGIVRRNWLLGMAWKDNSRDLGYAVQAALGKIRESGELDRICRTYRVTYTPPPAPK